jgi:hypothetical protein
MTTTATEYRNPKCESKAHYIACSDAPEYFATVVRWGGRTWTQTECLTHAVRSETNGQETNAIRA